MKNLKISLINYYLCLNIIGLFLNNTNSTIKANNYKKCSNNGVEDIIRLYYRHNLVAYLDLDDIKEIV